MTASLTGVVQELVSANHILMDQGVVDAFGHVSVRHPNESSRYLMSKRMPPGHVGPDDILEFNLDSEVETPGEHPVFLERFIHGEIYRARADVQAVVHSHSHSVVPLGVVKAQSLRAVFHMGAFLGEKTPVFEIRDVRGDGTDMLIRDAELGRALARSLGDGPVVLMRGHGATIVGDSLRRAVVSAVYTEVNARLQSQAMMLGEVTYLSAAEARAAAETGAPHIDRAWTLWSAEAKRNRQR